MTTKSPGMSGSSAQAGCFEKWDRAVAAVQRLAGDDKGREKAFADVLETPPDSDLTLILSLAELRPASGTDPSPDPGAKAPSPAPAPSGEQDGRHERPPESKAETPEPIATAPRSAMPSLKRLGLIILSAEAIAACGIVALWGPWLLSESIAHGLTNRGATPVSQPARAQAVLAPAQPLAIDPPPAGEPLSALEASLGAARTSSPPLPLRMTHETRRFAMTATSPDQPAAPSLLNSSAAEASSEMAAAIEPTETMVEAKPASAPVPEPEPEPEPQANVVASAPEDAHVVVDLPPELTLLSGELQVEDRGPAVPESREAALTELEVQRPVSAISSPPSGLPSTPAPPVSAEARQDVSIQRDADIAHALASERQVALHQERQRADQLARELAQAREEIGTLRSRSSPSWAIAPPLPTIQDEGRSGTGETFQAQLSRSAPAIPEHESTAMAALTAPVSTKPHDRPVAAPDAAVSVPPDRRLLERAEALLKDRDISGARLLLERAVQMGSARGAYLLAQTYDPAMLAQWQVRGIGGDMAKAQELYAKARASGSQDTAGRPSVR